MPKPPPIPFKAKSQAAKQGKPFFTPPQAEKAKAMEGPASAKAPWEKDAQAVGYDAVLSFLGLDKVASPATMSRLQKLKQTIAARRSPESLTRGFQHTPQAQQPTPPKAQPKAPPKEPSKAPPKSQPKQPSQPSIMGQAASNMPRPEGLLANVQNVKQTKQAPILNRMKSQWEQMSPVGKGMVAGGAGLGLLGGGIGLGSAMSSPDQPQVVVAR